MDVIELPPEILSRIFVYLHPREWLICENVCKEWWKILREFWDHVKEMEYESYGYIRLTFQDNHTYRLASSGEWDNDNTLLAFVLKRCGDQLEKLILHIPQELSMRLDPDTILLIGACCKHLKSLSLNGYVSAVAFSISVICPDLVELENIFIWDESFPYDSSNEMNSSVLAGDIFTTCTRLRTVSLNMFFIAPPSIDTCRRLANLQQLERIRWLFWSPLAPEFVENVFSCLVECRDTLHELNFSCKLKSPLNGDVCARNLRRLSETCPNLTVLDLGFQLHEAMHEEYTEEIFYDPIESAPWSFEFLHALTSFQRVRELSLRYFELSDDAAVESLKILCENLETLRIEDNYGVNGKLIWEIGTHLHNLKAFSISQAQLSHADLVELIQRCPKLTILRFSNVEAMSFKKLVLSTHSALHRCCVTLGHDDGPADQLNLKLDTARSYIHDEAEELKQVNLCGLTLSPPGHSNVIIDRICKRLMPGTG